MVKMKGKNDIKKKKKEPPQIYVWSFRLYIFTSHDAYTVLFFAHFIRKYADL